MMLLLPVPHPLPISAKPESPSWARMQQLVPPSSMSPLRVAPTMNTMALPTMNMSMMGGRQVSSESSWQPLLAAYKHLTVSHHGGTYWIGYPVHG
jgi:hypothetical protein